MKHSLKSFKNLRHNGGFTLTEVLIALLVFGMLMLAIMQLLAFSLAQKQRNIDIAQSIDEQSEMLAGSHGISFDDVLNNLELTDPFWDGASAHNIRFLESDETTPRETAGHCGHIPFPIDGCPNINAGDPCGQSANPLVNVSIGGDIAGYYGDDDIIRITSPRFSGIDRELDMIWEHKSKFNSPPKILLPGSKFFSDIDRNLNISIQERIEDDFCNGEDDGAGGRINRCGYNVCTDPVNHDAQPAISWVIDLSYITISPTDSKNYITYLIIPGFSEFIVVDDGARNADAHLILGTDSATGDDVYAVRIMNLSNRWARIKVTFTTDIYDDTGVQFYSYFDPSTSTPARVVNIAKSPLDEDNFTEASVALSLPVRPCRTHGLPEGVGLPGDFCPYFELAPEDIDDIFNRPCIGHGVSPCPAREEYKCLPEKNPCDY